MKQSRAVRLSRRMPKTRLPLASALMAAGLLASPWATAIELETGNPDLKVRWDNTVKFSSGFRVDDVDPILSTPPAPPGPPQPARFVGTGDRNFGKGNISNRLDLLTEFDVSWQQRLGVRFSGAAWYDREYLRSNDNPGPQALGDPIPFNEFSNDVRKRHGRGGELLDAFVYGTAELGEDVSGSVRLGRHALQWGESLFFGPNSVAGAMAPADLIKAISVPNSQTKELVRPVPQASGSVNFGPNFGASAYYQFRWEKSVLPVAGSYFSSVYLANQTTGATYTPLGTVSTPGAEISAPDSGQGGVQLRYTAEDIKTDFTLFAVKYHAKTPSGAYIFPGPVTTTRLVYQKDIQAFGGTFSSAFGDVVIASEASFRRNVPLTSSLPPLVGPGAAAADNGDNARYAIGRTAHLQVNASYTMPRNVLADEALLLAEVAWNRMLSVQRNPAALDTTRDRDATGVQVLFVPTYRQVAPGLDLSVPIGVRYTKGASQAVGTGFGPDGGGQFNIGLSGTYQAVWNFGLTYTRFLGTAGRDFFNQQLKDRDYVSLVFSTTF